MIRSPSVLRGTFPGVFLVLIVLGPGPPIDPLGSRTVFLLPLLPHLAMGLYGRGPGTKGISPRRHVLQVGHGGRGEPRVAAGPPVAAVVTQPAKDRFGQRYERDHVDDRDGPQGEESQVPQRGERGQAAEEESKKDGPPEIAHV